MSSFDLEIEDDWVKVLSLSTLELYIEGDSWMLALERFYMVVRMGW